MSADTFFDTFEATSKSLSQAIGIVAMTAGFVHSEKTGALICRALGAAEEALGRCDQNLEKLRELHGTEQPASPNLDDEISLPLSHAAIVLGLLSDQVLIMEGDQDFGPTRLDQIHSLIAAVAVQIAAVRQAIGES